MIEIKGVTKAFGGQTLLRGVDLRIGPADRIALVGPNGSGKTTLLELIARLQEPDAGAVETTRGTRVGYLPQEIDALRGRTVIAEVLSAVPAMSDAGERLAQVTSALARDPAPDVRDRLLGEYARLQERFETLGGYTAEAGARRILAGLGFDDEAVERPIESFSGGWMMRVALARLLVAHPEALLLDEPTNHLDLESLQWLERFLTGYEGAVLVVSHDRDFINTFATRVLELRETGLDAYTGNFEAFVRQRALRAEQEAAAARNQARKVAQTRRFIERFRYKAHTARLVQSRIKALERMEPAGVRRERAKTMSAAFPPPPRSGRVVLELRTVAFGYGTVRVYRDLDLVIERGQRVALVGPNGAGKTTLLKLIAGELSPDGGERRLGHNAAVGFFAQHRLDLLDPARTVLEELEAAIPAGAAVKPRDLLGRFLFSGDDVKKPVSVLSGGERTRLALARLLVSPVNLLCLDEPTNHLDIAARDALEEALESYGGTLVLITHDRHLIRSVADRILEVEAGQVRSFPMSYEDYLDLRERERTRDAGPGTGLRAGGGEDAGAGDTATPSASASPRERRRASAEERARINRRKKEFRRVETEMEHAHAVQEQLAGRMADPGFYTSGEDVAGTVRAYEAARRRLADLEQAWERLAGEMEETAIDDSGASR